MRFVHVSQSQTRSSSKAIVHVSKSQTRSSSKAMVTLPAAQDQQCDPPSLLLSWHCGLFPQGKNGLSVRLNTDLHQILSLGMSGARPLLSYMVCTGRILSLAFDRFSGICSRNSSHVYNCTLESGACSTYG